METSTLNNAHTLAHHILRRPALVLQVRWSVNGGQEIRYKLSSCQNHVALDMCYWPGRGTQGPFQHSYIKIPLTINKICIKYQGPVLTLPDMNKDSCCYERLY